MKIGDKVRFLNDVGGGIIKALKPGGIVLVEDEDGFEIPALADDIVVIDTNEYNFVKKPVAKPQEEKPAANSTGKSTNSGKAYLASKDARPAEEDIDETLEARVIRLEMLVNKLQMRLERLEDAKSQRDRERIQAKQQRKAQRDEILEVDLHAHELLETEAGMSAGDIKQYQLSKFNSVMQEHLKDKGKRIVFIHGKGDGILRRAILDELNRKYKQCEYQDASFQQYGFGATMVIIK